MYGTQAQYGWSSGPQNSDFVELPMRPVRRRQEVCCEGGISWLWYGVLLSLLAAASLALGVADVVLTYQNYPNDKCKADSSPAICDTNNLVWTWVASGIWGSLPIFIFGILAIRLGKKGLPVGHSWFELLAFMCTFIFSPAMIVLSAIEVYKGHNIYYWSYSGALTKDDLAKAIIPIVIAGLGLIEWLMLFIAVWYVCCCRHPNVGGEIVTVQRQVTTTVPSTFVQTRTPPACGPCQTSFVPSLPAPRGPSCGTGQCGGGNAVYYRPPATSTGFGGRPTTYNYFANSRPTSYSAYNQFR